MKLTITKRLYEEIVAAARAAAPMEACGLLGGSDGEASEFYELSNADASPVQYRMLPEEQLAAIKDMRKKSISLVAIWHSHPATGSYMSERDLKLAFTPDVAYVVVSLAEPSNPDIRAFTVENGMDTRIELEIGCEDRPQGIREKEVA